MTKDEIERMFADARFDEVGGPKYFKLSVWHGDPRILILESLRTNHRVTGLDKVAGQLGVDELACWVIDTRNGSVPFSANGLSYVAHTKVRPCGCIGCDGKIRIEKTEPSRF
jgi:hypothetical protein